MRVVVPETTSSGVFDRRRPALDVGHRDRAARALGLKGPRVTWDPDRTAHRHSTTNARGAGKTRRPSAG
jgi:hypothetical protein